MQINALISLAYEMPFSTRYLVGQIHDNATAWQFDPVCASGCELRCVAHPHSDMRRYFADEIYNASI